MTVKTWGRLCSAALVFASVASAEIVIQHIAPYIAKEVHKDDVTVYVPETRFSCNNKITFVSGVEQYHGKTLTLIWTDPHGEDREIVKEKITAAVVWRVTLALSPEQSLTIIEGSSGGYEEFIGHWTVRLYSGDEHQWSDSFEIMC